MNETTIKLDHPPIVEAVVDIDCDFPPGFDLQKIEEAAAKAFGDRYPKHRQQHTAEHQVEIRAGAAHQIAARVGLQALQFVSEDERQLVQIRIRGFSFNRLAPYTGLDDYLPEIEATWKSCVKLTRPLKVLRVCLRYINRILLPLAEGKVRLEDFLQVSPRLPDEANLKFKGFLRQHIAVEESTGNEVTLVLTTQPAEPKCLPLIFDIAAGRFENLDPEDWKGIGERIESLRSLKNRVFHNTLTDKCLNLFQQ